MVQRNKPKTEGETIDIIMASAVEEFGEFGLHGARIDSIAKRSGLNKAMIYYYYKSKEELYEAIIKTQFSIIHDTISPAFKVDESPDKRINNIIKLLGEAIRDIDDNTKRILLWEIASGGKVFSKVVAPKFIKKIIPLVKGTYSAGKKQGIIRDEINPFYTQMIMVGSLLFANNIYMVTKKSPILRFVFGKNFHKDFIENLTAVITSGVIKK
jgi:TetR/AcrR family transcriptional regulator